MQEGRSTSTSETFSVTATDGDATPLTGSATLTVNVTTKILGRSGYTTAILVSNPETLDKDLIDFKIALKNFDYVSGEKYSEWKQGDHVAAYGLGALVLGGAAAVASKKGFFAVILGFIAASWKFVAVALIAGLGWIKSLFSRKK